MTAAPTEPAPFELSCAPEIPDNWPKPNLRLIHGTGGAALEASYVKITDPDQLITEQPDLTQIARGIVQSLESFIPKLNGRVPSTPAALNAWHRMPDWQKMGLRLRDPSFADCPLPLQAAIREQVQAKLRAEHKH